MSRVHIEFLNTEEQAWQTHDFPGFSEEMKQKILSKDHQSGAITSLVYLPEGIQSKCGRYNYSIELLLLEGNLTIGNEKISDLTHVYVDKGEKLPPIFSDSNCRLLIMTEGHLELMDNVYEAIHNGIRITKTSELPWEGTITPGFPTGAMRKSLFQHPETGASSWLLGVLPQFKDSRYEIHPVAEEGFQIYGNLNTSIGNFSENHYFWRPSEIPHGGFNTNRGCLTFFRTDGPLQTTYVEFSDFNKP